MYAKRVIAYLIDILFIMIISNILGFIGIPKFSYRIAEFSLFDRVFDFNSLSLTGFTLFILYFAIFEFISRASPGKRIVGIQVVSTYDIQKYSFGLSLKRSALKFASQLLFIGFLPIFSRDRLTFHDALSRTSIIKKPA